MMGQLQRVHVSGAFRGVYALAHAVQDVRGPSAPLAARIAVPPPAGPWLVYLQGDDDTIYQVDLGQRTVRVALAGQSIRSSALLVRPTGQRLLVVRTADSVLVLDHDNRVVRQTRLPEELRERTSFLWFELPGGEALTCRFHSTGWRAKTTPCDLAWYDADGRVLRREETTLEHPNRPSLRWVLGAAVPAPLVLDAVVVILPLTPLAGWASDSYPGAVALTAEECWPSLAMVHLLAVLLAGLCYRRQVRYQVGGTGRWLWPTFVLLLGWPGWLAYRYGRAWPVLERCPACGAARPIDREDCGACQTEAAPPALKGTEVFA
jgi:hypothetical protein